MFRNFKTVSRVIYGRRSFTQLEGILEGRRGKSDGFMVFLVDDVFKAHPLRERIPCHEEDRILWVNVNREPHTDYVDDLTLQVRRFRDRPPQGVIGIGGGSTLDLAKAVALMLTHPGSAADYQGWDLIRHPGIYHVGVPTLSGTGAAVSRTTVLIGPKRKLGINSDHTVFDQIVLDPDLTAGVPVDQWFYTGMDCYIHCVESLSGTYINAFSKAYGEKAMALCRDVYLSGGADADEKLMMASYFGGMSIVYSQVGVCHALSYGLSFVLGIHHGIGNCMVFNQLEEFYPEGVAEFRRMMERHHIALPQHRVSSMDPESIDRMADVALTLDPLWENALGKDWRNRMPRSRIQELYLRM